MKTLITISCVCLFFGLVAWLRAEILKAPLLDEPKDLMTAEEQEALANKDRLQREMHERGRDLRGKLSNRINQ